MNLKRKVITLIICGLIVIFTASCSYTSDTEKVEKGTTASTQVETDENGEAVEKTQAENQQDDGTVNDGETVKDEDTDSESENPSTESSNENTDADDKGNESETTAETDSTKNNSDDGNTTDDYEEPLDNVEVEFDNWDF